MSQDTELLLLKRELERTTNRVKLLEAEVQLLLTELKAVNKEVKELWTFSGAVT